VSERNAPCPCGSGLKFKKCCLKLSQSLKATKSGITESSELDVFISSEAHSLFDEFQDLLEEKESTRNLSVIEFEEALTLVMHIWNTSKMSAGYRNDLLKMTEKSKLDKVIKDGSKVYEKLFNFDEMIVGFEIHDFKYNAFDFTLERRKVDKSWIREHIDVAAEDINNCWEIFFNGEE
jgi:hypothetical protein